MAAVAAALGAIGQKVLNLMGVFWLVEEVVQRIQVAQMIQQRQQMIQARKQEKGAPSYLKSWDWTISAGSAPGRYKYTLSFTGNVPTEPVGFYRHVYLSTAFYILARVTPQDIHLAKTSLEVKSPKFSYKFTFTADDIMSGVTIQFEDVKATEICLFWDFVYEGTVNPIPFPSRTTSGEPFGMGGGCGGEWRSDWVHIDWQAGRLEYHRIHADPMSFGEEPFEVADALQLQSQIDDLMNARDQLKDELKDLASLAARVARYYERVEYPVWFVKRYYDNIYQRYQELVKAWRENTDAIRKILDQLSAIAPEDAGKISKTLRDPKTMPSWDDIKQMVPRPDPTPYLSKVQNEIGRYEFQMKGYYADAKSAAHNALASLWSVGYDEYVKYTRAKTDAEKIAIAERLLQKLPAVFWNYIGDMYNALANYKNAKARYEELDAYLRWYSGENVTITEQDIELVSKILGEVTGA